VIELPVMGNVTYIRTHKDKQTTLKQA